MCTHAALFQLCGLLILNTWLVYGHSPVDKYVERVLSNTHTQDYSRDQVKLCAAHSITKDQVEIPTFQTENYAYVLKNYTFDKENIFVNCSNGENQYRFETAITKTEYDKLYPGIDNKAELYLLLRSRNFLYHNGYLSVGNTDTQMPTYYSVNDFCVHAVRDRGNNTTVDFRICPLSKNRPTFRKCCPLGKKVMEDGDCVENRNAHNWDPGYMDAKSQNILSLDEANPVFTWGKLHCGDPECWVEDNCDIEFHPVTDNTIAYVGVYRTWQFPNFSLGWCMELEQPEGKNERMVLWHCPANNTNRKSDPKTRAKVSSMYMSFMYVGAIFNFLTTLVYLLTWRKQNIHGRTLCFCTASLCIMQLFLGTAHLLGKLTTRGSSICVANGIGAQYFMIAAFTWLVVLNYDLWKTFGSIRVEGGKGLKRLLKYNVFGWGFPLIVSIISVGLNFTFPCRTSGVPVPDFGKHYCFVAPYVQGIYVYYILGFLIAVTFVLSSLTWFGIYNLKKNSVNLRSTKDAEEKQKILLYVKLSVLMGLAWIFEVISWLASSTDETVNHMVWIILDFYNALSAILIFIFFVCKTSTLDLLEQTYPRLNGLTRAATRISSTFSFSGSTTSVTTESKQSG